MKFKAYPKVNLSLLIGNKNKKNNLHKIKSIFLLVKDNFYDDIEITFNKNSHINIIEYYDQNNKKIEIKNCLFLKAISLLKNEKIINNNLFFKIRIIKKIPLYSGLGSGACNVACLYKFLIRKKLVTLNRNLKKIILKTGSDVMFFIYDFDCAIVKRYGEKVKKIKQKEIPKIILFLNNIECKTTEVFNIYDLQKNKTKKIFLKQFICFKIKHYSLLENELIESVFTLYPQLKFFKDNIEKNIRKKIYLSGSGSSFFTYDI